MDTPNEIGGAPLAGAWAVRCCLAAVALGSIAWGVFCFPIFADQVRLDSAKDALLREIPLSDAELVELEPLLERAASRSYCVPAVDRSAAIVRLRLLDNAFIAGQGELIDTKMADLNSAIVRSLGCAPSDPYLWLVLFWLRNNQTGFSPKNLDLLRMSYRLGPNEAWIISKRNHIALAMFDALPPDLATEAVGEFSRLVKSELYGEAVTLLKGPGWPHRDRLLAGLAAVPKQNVDILVKGMSDAGYELEGYGRDPAGGRKRL
jgi:hypothetical protein